MQEQSPRIAPDAGLGLEPALRTLSRELAAGRELALDLQVTVGEVLACLGDLRCDALFRLQDLDRLAQMLGDLATAADAMAAAAPADWRIDGAALTRDLRLRDLALRLTGSAAGGSDASADAGDDFLL